MCLGREWLGMRDVEKREAKTDILDIFFVLGIHYGVLSSGQWRNN